MNARARFSTKQGNEQALVNDHFKTSALFWNNVYQQDGVAGLFFQHRNATALDWVERLHLPAGSLALDAGCGAGVAAISLAREGFNVWAVDPVPHMTGLTWLRAVEAGVNHRLHPVIGDVQRLAFGNNVFDVAIALGVIPWLHSVQKGISEMARVLKPGGYLILSADNAAAAVHVIDPFMNPYLQPLKRAARGLLYRIRARPRIAVPTLHRSRTIDRVVLAAGMQKIAACTVGFGPFTLFRREMISDKSGVDLYRRLQQLADRGVPILPAAGRNYLLLARKLAF